MKAKRWISLLLAVSMMLGVLAMPALAATQQPEKHLNAGRYSARQGSCAVQGKTG